MRQQPTQNRMLLFLSRQKTDVPAKLDCQIVKAALRSKGTRMERSYCKDIDTRRPPVSEIDTANKKQVMLDTLTSANRSPSKQARPAACDESGSRIILTSTAKCWARLKPMGCRLVESWALSTVMAAWTQTDSRWALTMAQLKPMA